jgi:hypothetical protein
MLVSGEGRREEKSDVLQSIVKDISGLTWHVTVEVDASSSSVIVGRWLSVVGRRRHRRRSSSSSSLVVIVIVVSRRRHRRRSSVVGRRSSSSSSSSSVHR